MAPEVARVSLETFIHISSQGIEFSTVACRRSADRRFTAGLRVYDLVFEAGSEIFARCASSGVTGPAEISGDRLVTLGAAMLRMVLEYDTQIAQGQTVKIALQSLRVEPQRHDAELLKCLESLVGAVVDAQEVSEMPVGRVRPGMIFLDELRTSVGTLLVPKSFEVTGPSWSACETSGPASFRRRCAF